MSATKSQIARPSADVLRTLYVDDGLGCPDIGKKYERDAKTVLYWLKQAGIETRKRGTNPGPQFKKGVRSAFAGRTHNTESRAKIGAASLEQGRVPYLRNGVHWLHTVTPDQNPNWKGGATPERQEFYRSKEWKDACKAVWRRADAKCERCATDFRTQDRSIEQFHIHHIVSFRVKEMRTDQNNLALLCKCCHRWVHSKKNVGLEFIAEPLFSMLEQEAA
jgi:hypothetical protein